MIWFLIKKTFFDSWDNLFHIFLLNLGFIISVAISVLIPKLIFEFVPGASLFAIVSAGIGALWCCVYLAAAALSVKSISDYRTFGFADFGANLKAGWPVGLVLGLAGFIFFLMIKIVIPFYFEINSIVGLILGILLFWTLVMTLISFQFFYAIRARLDTRPLKIIKKCFIIFFDNSLFSIFCLMYSMVTLALSPAFLLPGPAGTLLFLDEALRLRLLKYDWLEANPPDMNSRKRLVIPWDAILIEEREKTGTRTFRNFIFPWRD